MWLGLLLASLLGSASSVSILSVFPPWGSTAGGTYLVINGEGFQFPTEANPWDSQAVYVGSVPCKIVPHYTGPMRIVCLTGPSSGAPWTNVWGQSVSVQQFSGLAGASYAVLNNAFSYTSDNTPTLYWAQRWAATGGDNLSFGGWMSGAPTADMYQVQIGDIKCITDQEVDPLVSNYQTRQIQCQLPDTPFLQPGHYNLTVRGAPMDPKGSCSNIYCFPWGTESTDPKAGYGNGLIVNSVPWPQYRANFAGTVDLETGEPYHFTVYPEVESTSPSFGSTAGGGSLTIIGTSFSTLVSENEVTVGGVPCEVTFAASDMLICTLGDQHNYSDTDIRTTGTLRGLRYRTYDQQRRRGVYRSWQLPMNESQRVDMDIIEEGVLKAHVDMIDSEQPDNFQSGAPFVRESIGFFVPPLTANYTFYTASDDDSTLQIEDVQGAGFRQITLQTGWAGGAYPGTNPGTWFTASSTQSSKYYGNESQVSWPISLQGGHRYPFRIVHADYGGGVLFRFGVKIGGLQNATKANGQALGATAARRIAETFPLMELQRITLGTTANLRRETHYIVVTRSNTTGTYTLRLTGYGGLATSVKISYSATESVVYNSIRFAALLTLEAPRIHNCDNIQVTSVAIPDGGRNYTIRFNCMPDEDKTSFIQMAVISTTTPVVVGLLQSASLPIRGTFQVGFDGFWSAPIQPRSPQYSWWSLAPKMSLVRPGDDSQEELNVEAWPAPRGADMEGFDMFMRFRKPVRNLSLLEINASNLLGEDFALTVTPVQDGDPDAAFIERMPADYFEMPAPNNSIESVVRVVSNGVLAAVKGTTLPTYIYSDNFTIALSSVSPTTVTVGSTITVSASNFLAADAAALVEDVVVYIGDRGVVPCAGLTLTSNMADATKNITCVVQDGPAGQHLVRILSKSQGLSSLSSAINLTLLPVVYELSPTLGSIMGGTAITVQGTGLSGLQCGSILVGGAPCIHPTEYASSLVQMAQPSVTCLTPADSESNGNEDLSYNRDVEVKLLVAGLPDVYEAGNFTYERSITPFVQALSPTMLSGGLSGVITIDGYGFGSTALPVVRFEDRDCTVRTHTENQLTCWLSRCNTPTHHRFMSPTVWVPDLGLAEVNDSVTLNAAFEIHQITPSTGSAAGGAIIVIDGFGFSADPMKNSVALTLYDGTTVRHCKILDGSMTRLRCQLEGGMGVMPEADGVLSARRLSQGEAIMRGDTSSCRNGGDDHAKAHCLALRLFGEGRSVRSAAGTTHAAQSVPADLFPSGSAASLSSLSRRLQTDHTGMTMGGGHSTGDPSKDAMMGELVLTLNGVDTVCKVESGCVFTFNESLTPRVVDVHPLNGSHANGDNITVEVANVAQGAALRIWLGEYECPVLASQSSGMNNANTVYTVSVCAFEASTVEVYARMDPYGYAEGGSPYSGAAFTFTQLLNLSSVNPASGPFYGGTEITIDGNGFQVPAEGDTVMVGGKPCEVSYASYVQLKCFTPRADGYGMVYVSVPVLSVGTTNGPTLPFTYNSPEQSPLITSFVETPDSLDVQVTGLRFGDTAGILAFGSAFTPTRNFNCTPTQWTATSVTCTRPRLPAGEWIVRLWTTAIGWSNPAPQSLLISAVVNSVEANGVRVDIPDTINFGSLVMKMVAGAGTTTFGYNSGFWTNETTLNADSPESTLVNAKYAAFNNQPFNRIRFCSGGPRVNCTDHTFAKRWSSARALFSAGYIEAELDQGAILRSMGARDGTYRDCPMMKPGFNVECQGGNKARWGYCASCPSRECVIDPAGVADAVIGIGLVGEGSTFGVGAGWTNYFAGGAGTCNYASNGQRNVWVWVDTNTAAGSVSGSYGGGVQLTLRGSGLGLNASQTEVTVCGAPCPVTYSNESYATCTSPAQTSSALINAYPAAFPPQDLASYAATFGSDRGNLEEAAMAEQVFTSSSSEISLIYNGRWNTRSACWFGFELPEWYSAYVNSAGIFPPVNPYRRAKMAASVMEVRNRSDSNWTVVANLSSATLMDSTVPQGWNLFKVDPPVLAQVFRIRILNTACSDGNYGGYLLRGARFTGIITQSEDTSVCKIELVKISHPLARSFGQPLWGRSYAELVHSLDKTPVLNMISPTFGTARGGTSVTLSGLQIQPEGGSEMRVNFNGYSCVATAGNQTQASCVTGSRIQGITPPSTSLWVQGKGNAIIAGLDDFTTFRYIDRWSDPLSWADSEMPVDGDTVVVPEGQSILLDIPSPKLFLLLISGNMEFDRRPLTLDATYIWIAGGHLQVGTETMPFEDPVTITLHGDRWNTIELPFIGCKMIAVTNLGGLTGSCMAMDNHAFDPNAPDAVVMNNEVPMECPARSVGKLDLHGHRQTSWTHLVETVGPGSTTLKLAEPVTWPNGSSVVITPSRRGEEEEVRKVENILDNGFTLVLDQPLKLEHLGVWYHNPAIPTPTDLRAAVGLLNRNILIKGDDSTTQPGNSFMFGAHVGAFHGGTLRIENVEFFHTGQSGNLGRYTTHFHHISASGRTVDVLDKAYIRNNTFHETFQRGVVVHGTNFAVVMHNVAHHTRGHTYFTEDGSEKYALFEHNLAVHPLPHPVLLEDDVTPACFWLPGFTGWHRSNMAANCHRGWKLRVLDGLGRTQTDFTFFNNSAHACDFGWHLFPPHQPPTPNHFRDFTVVRSNMGMFYYSSGNIVHENHRFVECLTGQHMNHYMNNLHSLPWYLDLYIVGEMNAARGMSSQGMGLSGPKDDEYFFVSGLTAINFFDSPVLHGCWETMCTMRYERTRFFNSSVRTFRPPLSADELVGAIYHDLDGTLTGFKNGFVCEAWPFNEGLGTCRSNSSFVGGHVCGSPDGNVRVRRLHITADAPDQLLNKNITVITSVGKADLPFVTKKLFGWAIPVLENQSYDIKVLTPNDFQIINLKYAQAPYVFEEHGLNTTYHPKDEAVEVHLNYTDWRDHFDGSQGLRLNRRPTRADPFGSFALKLWEDQCHLYVNLTGDDAARCNGSYMNETGLALKLALDENPELPQVHGRLTTFLATHVNNTSEITQTFQARECPVAGCPTPDTNIPLGAKRFWSDASKWPNQRLPAEMDDVVIAAGEWVVLDMVTPILNWLTVMGKFEVSREHNTTLNAHSIKVWGIFEMGTADSPIPPRVSASIVFYGDYEDHTVIMTEGLFLVNKVIAVLGNFNAAGTISPLTWSKLTAVADVGSTILTVRGNLTSWPVGASIGIGSTEFPNPPASTDAEVRVLSALSIYDPSSNTTTLTLDQPLVKRHFAGIVNTDPFVRLEATVALLSNSSNVVIRNSEPDTDHGGYIAVGGSSDGQWVGSANLTGVQFVNLGKFEYEQPAIYFNRLGDSGNILGRLSRVERCIFSFSQAGGVRADNMPELELRGNVFHRTYSSAVRLTKLCKHDRIRIVNNVALETLRHPMETITWVRSFSAFFFEVRLAEFSGNVASSSTDTGFTIRPAVLPCVNGSTSMPPLGDGDLNEAVGCITGFFLLKACPGICDLCGQLRGALAWKSSHTGIVSADQSANIRLDTIILSDNHIGVSLNFFRSTEDVSLRVYAYNAVIFGSTDASTCAASTECRALGGTGDAILGKVCASVIGSSFRRVGIMEHISNGLPKLCETNPMLPACPTPTLPVKPCVMPWEHRFGTAGSRYSENHWSDVVFGHFQNDDCGLPSVAITYNPTSIDVAHPYFFSNVRWLTTVTSGARYFFDRMTGNPMNQVSDCSPGSDCDGVANAVLQDVDGSLTGSGIAGGTVVPGANPALATSSCTAGSSTVFSCPNLKLRFVQWEPAGDLTHRSYGSFKTIRESDNQSTFSVGPFESNCMPQMPRQSRAWMIKPDDKYIFTLFGSPSKYHRFYYFADENTAIRIGLRLAQPFRLEVYLDSQLLDEKVYDRGLASPPTLPNLTDRPGTYAFDSQARTFYFVMRGQDSPKRATLGGGFIFLRLLQVVQLSLAMSVPVEGFDGPKMVQNIALLLNIDPKRIKVVSVQGITRRLRSLAGGQAAVVFQIVEIPTPLPPDAFGVVQTNAFNASNMSSSSSNNTSVNTSTSGFDSGSLVELSTLATTLQAKSKDGSLGRALGTAVVLLSVETTDPNVAIPAETTTVTTSTTITNTTTTTTTTTIASGATSPTTTTATLAFVPTSPGASGSETSRTPRVTFALLMTVLLGYKLLGGFD